MERVLVSGVSGPIGAALLPYLESQGARINSTGARSCAHPRSISWDPLQPFAPHRYRDSKQSSTWQARA